jgi:hypothetical protein
MYFFDFSKSSLKASLVYLAGSDDDKSGPLKVFPTVNPGIRLSLRIKSRVEPTVLVVMHDPVKELKPAPGTAREFMTVRWRVPGKGSRHPG